MKVYVLSGSSRGHEFENDWIVGAYTSKAKVEFLHDAVICECVARYKELQPTRGYFVEADASVVQSKLDPQMCFNGRFAYYEITETELDEGE